MTAFCNSRDGVEGTGTETETGSILGPASLPSLILLFKLKHLWGFPQLYYFVKSIICLYFKRVQKRELLINVRKKREKNKNTIECEILRDEFFWIISYKRVE